VRARAEAIGPRLEHDDEIAGLRFGQVHSVGQEVERRAQRSDDRCRLAAARLHSIADSHWIVLADHLAEVARRGEMVMAGRHSVTRNTWPREILRSMTRQT
jgi:uncharacterized protein involved in type VI secretion and phage assembly